MSSKSAAFAGCLLVAAALAGCGDHKLRLAVTPGGYNVRGDYIGSRRHVKLFVENLHAEPFRQGRGTAFRADLALLNERPADVRFRIGDCRLDLEGQLHTPIEGHAIVLRPGELTRVTVTFRSHVAFEDFGGGVLKVAGIEEAAEFQVPYEVRE